jgi:hypothetical protein
MKVMATPATTLIARLSRPTPFSKRSTGRSFPQE